MLLIYILANDISIINQMLTVQRVSGASMEDNLHMVQPREIYMGIIMRNKNIFPLMMQ